MIKKEINEMINDHVLCKLSLLINELRTKDEYMDKLIDVCFQSRIIFDGDDKIEEQKEALEHWLVSKWLGDALKKRGEMVIYNFLGLEAIWGRNATGQAICTDEVIQDNDIKSMGIIQS